MGHEELGALVVQDVAQVAHGIDGPTIRRTFRNVLFTSLFRGRVARIRTCKQDRLQLLGRKLPACGHLRRRSRIEAETCRVRCDVRHVDRIRGMIHNIQKSDITFTP